MNCSLRRPARLVASFLGLALFLPACSAPIEPSVGAIPDVEALSFACATSDPDTSSDPLVAACTRLVKRRTGYLRTCSVWGEPVVDEKAAIASCVGIAKSPGSLLGVKDLDACGAEICGGCTADGRPSCLGYEGNMLFPGHEKKGSGKPGDACVANLQCESGYCSAYASDCGHCVVPRAPGEACGDDDLCTGQGVSCQGGKCVLFGAAKGESCLDYAGGGCQAGLFCKTPDPSTLEGICEERGAIGVACGDGAECLEELYCGPASTCAPYLPDGVPCQAANQCEHACVDGVCKQPLMGLHPGDDCGDSHVCRTGLSCEDGVCVVQPFLPVGASCGGEPSCAPEDSCESACASEECQAWTCAPLPEAGEPCTRSLQCAGDAVCVGFAPDQGKTGTCTRKAGIGEPCPCGDDLACVNGMCVAFGEAVCN